MTDGCSVLAGWFRRLSGIDMACWSTGREMVQCQGSEAAMSQDS